MRALVIAGAVAAFLGLAWTGALFGAPAKSGLEAEVMRSYRLDHERGRGLELTKVHCRLSGFNPELVDRADSLGVEGPFDDCTVTFSDGTHEESCWSGAKDAYRIVWHPQPGDATSSDPGCSALLMRPVESDWSLSPRAYAY